MKKYRYHILIIILLCVVAFILIIHDKPGTLKVDDKAFATTDTSGISVIELSKGEKRLTLERSGSGWLVNGKFNARPNSVRVLLGLLMNIEIQSPVSKKMKEKAIRTLDKDPLKISIRSDAKTLKSYRIAEYDSLNSGSVAMLDKDDEPYVIGLPGFNGRLTLAFPVNPRFWRDRTIFSYGPADIRSVEILYPEDPGASFVYYFQDFSNILIKSLNGQKTIKINKETARNFLLNFRSVSFEKPVEQRAREIFDSVSKQKPFCEITVTNTSNKSQTVRTYHIPVQNGTSKSDVNRMYAVVQNDTVPVIVKYVDLDLIMKQYHDFEGK